MYKVTFKNKTTQYFDDIVFIKKTPNGYFTPTTENEATGVCLKLPRIVTNEDGEEQTYYDDKPFMFEENDDYRGGASFAKEIQVHEELDELNSFLKIIVGGK